MTTASPRATRPGHHGAGVAAEVALGPGHELDGKPKRRVGVGVVDRLPVGQVLQEVRALVPGHVLAVVRDVVAQRGADRDGDDIGDVEARGGRAHDADDLLEGRVLVADEVHLVDGDDHGLDAHERADGQVPVGLVADAAVRVDHEDGHVAVGRRDGHVAGVLLVARGVGDEHPAAVRQVHVPVRHVDRDALLPLGLEAVGEQRVVDVADRDRRAAAPGAAGVLELVERAPSRSRPAGGRSGSTCRRRPIRR